MSGEDILRKVGKFSGLAAVAALMGTFAAAPVANAAPQDCQWSSTALPVPAGYVLDNLGDGDGGSSIAGTVRVAGPDVTTTGVVWHDGDPDLIGRAFGQNTKLEDVSAAGTAVGFYREPDVFGEPAINHAVEYVHDSFVRLPDPPGFTNTVALRINGRGDIVGVVGESGNTGVYRAVVWPTDAPGTVKLLPPPHEGYQEVAGIDDDGNVAAAVIADRPGGGFGGYLWPKDGPAVHLAFPVADEDAVPTEIAGGRIAGYAGTSAFAWNLDGSLARELPGLQYVSSMNSAGSIVGRTPAGATWLLPADGGTPQVIAQAGESLGVSELTESGDLYGTTTTYSPDYSVNAVRLHCG